MGSQSGVMKVAALRLRLTLADYMDKLAKGLKWCTKCKQWKARDLFGIDNSRGDGLAARCFQCSRIAIRKQRKILAPSTQVRQQAADAIRWAIKRGQLAAPSNLPCFICGGNATLYHHHLGYAKSHRLDVQALFIGCHVRSHW